jgi:cation diffusion facilitator family transporter
MDVMEGIPSPVDDSRRELRRIARIKRTLLGVLGLNLIVAVAKLAVGGWTASISMVADGFHSLTDMASNIVGLIGISWAADPPDEDHPYGHWKYETLSALLIGALLTMTAWEVLESCVQRLRGGGAPRVLPISFVVMGITIVVNLAVSTWEKSRGKSLKSQILTADAAHTRSDVYVSLGVVASLFAALRGYPQVDALAALLITVVIARAAFQIVQRSAGHLTDAAVIPAEKVREIALTVAGVEGVHKIRSRGHPGGVHADLHVQVQADLRLDQAHVVGHLVSDRLREELDLTDVVVHVEPPAGHRTDWRPGEP